MKSCVTSQAHKDGTLPYTLPRPGHDSRPRQCQPDGAVQAGAAGALCTALKEPGQRGGRRSSRAAHHQVYELTDTVSSRLRACQSASLTHYMHKEHSGA